MIQSKNPGKTQKPKNPGRKNPKTQKPKNPGFWVMGFWVVPILETTPAEGQQSAQHEESHQAKRESGRRRKPNTRIFNNDFVTST